MQLIVPLSQRAVQVPPASQGFRSLRRKATPVGWWLLLLISLSSRLWAQQAMVEQPKVASFTLINAATGQDIQPLKAGDVLDLAALPAQLSIRANTDPWQVGSVVFDLNDKAAIRVENLAPYALASNQADSSLIFLAQFGSQGNGQGQFNSPSGIAVDGSGNLYVADVGNHRIQKFDSSGRFLSQLGREGSGQGQFKSPQGVAVDGSGHLYVVEQGNHRIQQFDSTGRFLLRFGTQGTGEGQFQSPQGVAVDGHGQVYVADAGNNRIQKFDASGHFLFQFGSYGTGRGQFSGPADVAVDGLDNFYVSDFYNHRIQKFDSTGRFLAKFGSEGSDPGQFYNPSGVVLDGSGNVYVADTYNNRIQKFTSSGGFLSQFGNPGQFYIPSGLTLDDSGNLYVADAGNHRIQKFSPSRYQPYTFQTGEYTLTATAYRQANGQGEKGAALTVNFRVIKSTSVVSFTLINATTGQAIQPLKEGDVLNLQGLPAQLSIRANTDPQEVGSVVFGLNDQSRFRVENFAPYALASNYPDDRYVPYTFQDGAYTLSATPYGQAKGQGKKGLTLTVHFQVEQPKVASFTLLNAATGQEIQSLQEGDVLALAALPPQLSVRAKTDPWQVGSVVFGLNDQSHFRVENFAPYALAGHESDSGFLFVSQSNYWTFDFGLFNGIVVDGSGNRYVTSDNQRILKFSSSGRLLSRFGSYGSDEGQFNDPGEMAVDGSGHLYVVDAGNHRIQQFDSTGHFLAQFGSKGSGEGQFSGYADVALDGSGHVYVADAGNHRIQKFSSTGRFLAQFGSEGSGQGQFKNPTGVAVDGSGNVFVVDNGNHRIQQFDSAGRFLSQFGSEGSGEGQFNGPSGVVADGNGHVYVVDAGNTRIQQFDSEGHFLSQYGIGLGEEPFVYRIVLAIDGSDNLYVADYDGDRGGDNRIKVFSPGRYRPYGFQVGKHTLTATPYSQTNGQGYKGQELTIHFQVAPSKVASFTLINVATGQGIQPLKEGDVLDLAKLPPQLSVRINTEPRQVGSVVFDLNKKAAIQVENIAPYALAGHEPDSSLLFLTTFGREGFGEGQFHEPSGVAVDGSGNLYVADVGNARIVKLDSMGRFLSQFGSYGSNHGQFKSPRGVAVDGSGNLYVVDAGNHRIQQFDSSGHFLFQFGSQGSGDGQFQYPTGVAVDGSGNVYVADAGNQHIQKFSPEGRFLSKFGSEGTGQGQFSYPWGVAVDGSGHVYVADGNNARIQKFDASGRFLSRFGSFGSGQGQFNSPRGVSVDGSGNLYVADGNNARIQKFDASGRFLAQFGSYGTGDGQFYGPIGVAVDGSGNLYVADTYNNRIQKYSSDHYRPYAFQVGKYILAATPYGRANGQGEKGLEMTVHFQVINSASVLSFTLLNAATGQDIQLLQAGDVLDLASLPAQLSIRANTNPWQVGSVVFDLNEKAAFRVANSVPYALAGSEPGGRFLAQFGSYGSGEGHFNGPSGVAVDALGNLYVLDQGHHRIQKLSSSGRFLAQFGSQGSGEGQFKNPTSMVVDGSGHLFIADRDNHRIVKLDSMGRFLSQFGSRGSGNGQFKSPTSVAVDGSGQLYVADAGNNRIQQFDSTGRFLLQFGSQGSSEGQFQSPQGVTMDHNGNLYVADSYNHRIQKFDSTDRFLAQFGTQGTGEGQFYNPSSLTLDGSGNIYVADTWNNRIQKFDASGRFLGQFGNGGRGQGQFNSPIGLAVDGSGNLYVADAGNHRIQQFSSDTYRPYSFQVREYALVATPYSQPDGKGEKGLRLAVNFRVVKSTSAARTSVGEGISSLTVAVYPNPFIEQVVLLIRSSLSQAVEVQGYDAKGRQIGKVYEAQLEAGQVHRVEITGGSWPEGLYFLRVSTPQGQLVKKVIRQR